MPRLLAATVASWFVLAALLVPSVPSLGAAEPTRPPNIVVVFCDDLGYGDVGCFGATSVRTPNIDRLAREGVRLTDFYVAQAVCSASRTALLTGCYPNRVGIAGALGPGARHGLHPEERTVADVLKARGYATAAVGKWHLGHHPPFLPTRHGFDEWFGLPYSNDMWPFHPEAKKGTYPDLPLFDGETIVDPQVDAEDQKDLTTRYTERAVRFVERNRDRPFFLYLAHSMPHVPLFVADKHRGKSKAGLFGDVIAEIDGSVGRILDTLRRHDLEKNTLVIFTSDNGPWLSYGEHAGSAGPLREGKGTAWEGGVRVPFVARWPGRIPAGSVSREPAMTIDLLPTFATIAQAPLPPKRIDGLDITPLLTDPKNARSPHSALWFYYNDNELQAVRAGRWKLVLPHTYRTLGTQPLATGGIPAKYRQLQAGTELYDLNADIGETTDLAQRHPEVVAELMKHAEAARADLGDSLVRRPATGARPAGKLEAAP
ncbi:MAG: sulfatase [Verrucomicrobiales bacterium]|nr:sulfatase [Verrucomicrobiales bacterium]